MSKRSLGTLTVDLILKMGGFAEGMDAAGRKTKQNMREIQKSVDESAKRVKNFVAAGAAAIAAGFAISAGLVNSSRQAIDAQAKLARTLDTTYDSLTALRMAAGDSGIDGLEQSLARMNSRLGAVEMNAGPALKTVKALNLDMKAMADMDVDEKIGYIGDRINELGLSNQEASRHLRQLGFEQEVALELFKNGSENIAKYRREVEQFGLSLTEIETSKIEAANDALGIFGDITEAFGNKLTVGAASTIKGLASAIEEAWIETENFGLASAEFEHIFSEAVARSLEAAASLIEFFDSNSTAAGFGFLGYLLLGPKGALLGGVIGSIFAGIEQQLRKWGYLGTDEDAAELARIEDRIESLARRRDDTLSQATAGMINPEAYRADLQAQIDQAQAAADEIRAALSPEALFDYEKHFAPSEDNGFASFLRAAAGGAREGRNFVGPLPSARPTGSGGDNEERERLQTILDLYSQTEASMQRQIGLFGVETETARVFYEMQRGNLQGLNEDQQERLLGLAYEFDQMRELAEQEKARKEELEKQSQQITEFGAQAARNIQSQFADYLFNPFESGLKGMAKNFGKMILRMSTEVASAKMLKSLFGGLSGSANPMLAGLGNAFAGMFDAGGSIPAGGWGIVGEIGPEIVRGPATVTGRQDTARALGGNVQVNIINNAGVNVRQGQTRLDGGRTTIDVIIDAVKTGMAQGQMDDVLAQTYGLSRAGGRG